MAPANWTNSSSSPPPKTCLTTWRWQDGSELPEFSSPEAKKGGTWYTAVQDYPAHPAPGGAGCQQLVPPVHSRRRGYEPSPSAILRTRPSSTATSATTRASPSPGPSMPTAGPSTCASTRRPAGPTASRSPPTICSSCSISTKASGSASPGTTILQPQLRARIVRYDELTFSVTLPEAKPNMIGRVLQLEPLPEHFFDEFGDDYVDRYQWRFVPPAAPT
jgi:microcin C transport system substrate-binding protein